MSGWLRWVPGRQGSEYFKMLLGSALFPIPWDAYLIKFPAGSWIDKHTDPIPTKGKHFRLNITLNKGFEGGYFGWDEPDTVKSWWRFLLFRPDITPHKVSKISEGTRYLLSIGWIWPR